VGLSARGLFHCQLLHWRAGKLPLVGFIGERLDFDEVCAR
jgi:hypothetical protein